MQTSGNQVDLPLLGNVGEAPYRAGSGDVTLMPTAFEGDFSVNSMAHLGHGRGFKDGANGDQSAI